MDALLLARFQFAFTVSFHFIFPAFSIGLASFLMVLEALWLKTGKPVYQSLYRYWLKIFALVFGMGVVSGHDLRSCGDLGRDHRLCRGRLCGDG